ncbi:MAG: phosphoglycerate dehydrogenase [Pirellulaceae bacterium]|jgi:phosphoglycerate dehydrogenase-like enzyme
MQKVLIVPESLNEDSTCIRDLRSADLEPVLLDNVQYARGLCSTQEAIEVVRGFCAVIAGGMESYSREIQEQLPDLRAIARAGVGYDCVDVAAATELKKAVCITPTANHEAVAELALSFVFSIAKNLLRSDKMVRGGDWSRQVLSPVRTKTIGVVGLGRIGRSMASRCRALGMNVIVFEKYPDEAFVAEHDIQLVDFPELLAQSDYVTLHCPLNDETRGMINAAALGQMKDSAVLINTARGQIVNEADLITALKQNQIHAAALDVLEQEPPDPANPLFEMDNVLLTPHLAGADEISMERMGVEAAQAIICLSRGEWLDGAIVNDSLKNSWTW